MNRNRKIVSNTIVFAIGNFGSKILTYVMVLVYTHYINAPDLGYYDLILTTVSLILPIFLMAFDEGIYRWLIGDEKAERKEILSTCLKVTTIRSLCGIGLLFLLNLKFHFRDISLIALFIISSMLYQMVLNAIRGLTNNKLYAGSGILNSLLILLFEAIGLIYLSMGIEALLISKMLANFITSLFIYLREPAFRGISKVPINKVLAKEVFKYSMPIIPNQISWWIVNSSDRYIILAFLGTTFNGIYTVSNKFPTIITTITGIIYIALQEIIIKEYTSDDRDEFYSETLKKYYVMLFCLILCAIPATKVIINWFVSTEYLDAWKFTGFLYLSIVFSALSSFLGIGYQISKETKRSVFSTASAAGINILINFIFIRTIGLHAASISTFIAYLSLFIIRVIHSKKYFDLKINWISFGTLTLASVGMIICSYLTNVGLNIGLTMVAGVVTLYLNKTIIKTIIIKRNSNGIKKARRGDKEDKTRKK